jgi:cytochrome c-type biogenesis protein CcmH/NrfG
VTCVNCSAEVPASAKFCPECGSQVGVANCPNCGEALKSGAKFCHKCGQVVSEPPTKSARPAAGSSARATAVPRPRTQRWLTMGAFFIIPVFAGLIIALLFWKNREPEPLQAAKDAAASEAMPSMAAMESVHKTLERLKHNLEANPEDLVSIDSLATMFSIAGSFDKASKYYERHLEIEPDNNEIKMALAHSYFQLKRTSDALALVQGVLKKEPTNVFALYNLGVIYGSEGKKDEAIKHLQIIVDTYPGTEWAKAAQQLIHDLTHVNNTSNK